jgi:dolichyl-phosphate beta-glucosyltransferase
MERKHFKVSIVVPVYNMENEIDTTVGQLINYLGKNFEKFEVIFINDGSSDSSLLKLQKIKQGKNVKIANLRKNLGKGAAIKKGVQASTGDYIVFTDADLPYDLKAISNIICGLRQDCDVALGSRQLPTSKFLVREKFHRKVLSAIFSNIAKLILLEEIKDTQCGLKGFSKKAANTIFNKVSLKGFAFDVEVIYLAQKYGYNIKLFPVKLVHNSTSTVNVKHMFSMLLDLGILLKRSKLDKF